MISPDDADEEKPIYKQKTQR